VTAVTGVTAVTAVYDWLTELATGLLSIATRDESYTMTTELHDAIQKVIDILHCPSQTISSDHCLIDRCLEMLVRYYASEAYDAVGNVSLKRTLRKALPSDLFESFERSVIVYHSMRLNLSDLYYSTNPTVQTISRLALDCHEKHAHICEYGCSLDGGLMWDKLWCAAAMKWLELHFSFLGTGVTTSVTHTGLMHRLLTDLSRSDDDLSLETEIYILRYFLRSMA
jgi:hypothetical protein